jgi:DNA-binding MarR family transcriptional regulator
MNKVPEQSEKEIIDSIRRTLEEIKAILVLTNQEKLEETKKELLKEGSVKQQIYNLCDGTRTTKEIADAIKNESSYVSSYLTTLRREGFIRTVEKDGRQIHEQIF